MPQALIGLYHGRRPNEELKVALERAICGALASEQIAHVADHQTSLVLPIQKLASAEL